MKHIIYVCWLVVLFMGCSAKDDADVSQSTRPSMSSLKVDKNFDVSCAVEEPAMGWRGWEPSLAAWVQSADAIFVGTLVSVERVMSPTYLVYTQENGEQKNMGPSACEADEVNYAIKFTFKDVESLHGEQLPEILEFQLGFIESEVYPQVGFDEAGTLLDANTMQPAYLPGARIGAAVFKDSAGQWNWNYRQFQVIGGTVHVQGFDDFDAIECNDTPLVTMIPSRYDQVSLVDFVAEIETAAQQPLTPQEQASVMLHHEAWLGRVSSPDFQMRRLSYCEDSWHANRPPEDPATPNHVAGP